MSDWTVALFAPADGPEWESVVAESGNGSLLHTRAFLAYHGERFQDRSLTIRDAAGRLRGIVPAAESPEDASVVVSHPGATFAGMLTAPDVTGAPFQSMFREAVRFWGTSGYRDLVYKVVPSIYHRVPRHEDSYMLWRFRCELSRRTLSACIDLAYRRPVSSRRKRSLAKALRSGCAVKSGYDVLEPFWPVAEATLLERHGVRPVHTLAEIQYLARCFPSQIDSIAAFIDGEALAGVVLFNSPTVTHVQYSLSGARGFALGAMDLLIEEAIERSVARGARFFDLGISTDPTGSLLNESLHQFKMEFGAGTIVYEQVRVALQSSGVL